MTDGGENDAMLVRLALGGEHEAFAVLARRHGTTLARTARALGVSASEVEDVTQAALLAAWRSLADYDPARPFVAWVSVIAANKARDWRRRRRVRSFFYTASLLQNEVHGDRHHQGGEDAANERQMLRQTMEALDAMPDALRLPLVLTAVSGLSQRDAAAVLGLNIKALESRILRARRHLSSVLKEKS